MAKASPALTNFNAGELSPQMSGRVDFDKYPAGCATMENFIPLVQGPAMRRAGTRYVNEVKSSSNRTWLVRFEFSATQAYILEFGDQYIRFYTNHGQVQAGTVTAWSSATAYGIGDTASSGGVNYYCILAHTNHAPPNATYWYAMPGTIYEIPSPYYAADLVNSEGAFTLNYVQSGDVLYLAGGAIGSGYQPYTLTRYSNNPPKWAFAAFAPSDGPFLELNSTTATIQASGQTGTVTLTASTATFASTDVGRLVRLDVESFTVPPWTNNVAYAIGDQVRNNGMTYKALNAATSGSTNGYFSPPVHLFGSAYDSKTGVNWQYQDSAYGIVKIASYTSATSVTGTVVTSKSSGLNQLPSSVVGTATSRWYLGAWSDTTEWPRVVAFYSDRLFWAGKQRVWGSVPSLYTSYTRDFNGQVTTDASIWAIVSAGDVSNVTWMASAQVLLIGTSGGEFGLGPMTPSLPLGPANVHIIRQSKMRCRTVQPELVGTSVLYVQRAARKLLAMDYNFYLDRYDSTNQTRLAYHLTKGGIFQIHYQAEPFQVLWAVRSDGQLLGYTFDREDQVTGWHRHILGGSGIVESIAAVPAPDGNRDELWMIVRRTINGVTKRYVEFMEKHYEAGDTQSSCFYVDAGLTYSGSVATTISGLSHLEGQTVSIFADGAVQPQATVSGGAITLSNPASVVNVGLPYTSTIITQRIDAGADVGTSQGKTKRVNIATIRVVDTMGGVAGMDFGPYDSLMPADPTINLDNPPAIYTGDIAQMTFPGDYDTDCQILVRQADPAPMTVAGIFPYLTGNEPT
jgi:hypothetical protein